MLRFLPVLAFLAPALSRAETPEAVPAVKEKLPELSLLPDGSELKGVMLPRYDENHKLTGVSKSRLIRLVRAGEIAGEQVSMEFFGGGQASRGRADFTEVTFFHSNGALSVLTARESVKIHSDRMAADGTGLHYDFKAGRGFLKGPATTILRTNAETTMNSKAPTLRATAAIGLYLVSLPLAAAEPMDTTEAETAAILADSVSRAPAAEKAAAETRASLEKDLADSEKASKAFDTFLVQADLPAVPAPAVPPPVAPLNVNPGPNDTVIKCDGGIYFDPEDGVLVYRKNVTVKDSRFDLSGTVNELKVFFGKKPEKEQKVDPAAAEKAAKDKARFGGSFAGNFGDVERIVATGAVVLKQKAADDKPPIEASGAIFTYNLKEDQIVIRGGFPWVRQGQNYLRASESDLNLRISPKAGSFVTEGPWEMGGNLEQKK